MNETQRSGRFWIQTLGCKANFNDADGMAQDLRERGWIWDPVNPDVCVVNSCTVTNEADRQSRQVARGLKKKFPQAQIVFTGCGAEVVPEHWAKEVPEIDWVVGNREKNQFAALLTDAQSSQWRMRNKILGSVEGYRELASRHPMDREWALPSNRGLQERTRTRVFYKIQEGCNSFCTFCIIPYGRGPIRSLPIDRVIKEIEQLVEAGAVEVVLTGTNIGAYGKDLDTEWRGGEGIAELCAQILERSELRRLRVSSLDPSQIEDRFLELMTQQPGRLCPHLHVSLQSISSHILKRMKRTYSQTEVIDRLEIFNRLPLKANQEGFVGMDVITGFPGESEEEFQAGVALLKKLPWSRLHVFPYSERANTPATRLGSSVPVAERKARAKALIALSNQRIAEHYQRAFKRYQNGAEILIEGLCKGPDHKKSWVSGYTDDYIRVMIPKSDELLNLQGKIRVAIPHTVSLDPAAGDAYLLGRLE